MRRHWVITLAAGLLIGGMATAASAASAPSGPVTGAHSAATANRSTTNATAISHASVRLKPAANGVLPAATHPCNLVFQTRNGRTGWYANYDNTWSTLTRRGQTGNRVIEVQCLVLSLGISVGPTGADGDFGPNTEAGVLKAQHLCFPNTPSEWDGIVGPHTWVCLRTF